MSSLPRLLATSGGLLIVSQILVEGAVFGRNIILANFLGAENLGIAASIALGLRLLEMISDVAVDRFLLQAPDGDSPELQSGAHGLNLARGFLVGVVFAAIGYPLSILVGMESSAGVVAALGLVPAMRGMVHLDHKRLLRTLNARSAAITESVASLIATALAWPIAALIASFEAIIWISVVQAGSLVVCSHLLAQRAYRVEFDGSTIMRFLRFGWPLILGGLCVFGALQGDRLIIALSCPMAELGRFTVVAQLALTPALMGVRVASHMFLPMLAQAAGNSEDFENCYRICLYLLTFAALCMVAGLLGLGGWLIESVYGSEFSVSSGVIALVSLAAALRLLRAAPTLALLAEGDSRSTMYVDVYRMGGLALSAVAGALTGELVWIVAGACAGEFIALIAAGKTLDTRRRLSLQLLLGAALAISSVTVVAWMGTNGLIWAWTTAMFLVAILVFLSVRMLQRADVSDRSPQPFRLPRLRLSTSASSSE